MKKIIPLIFLVLLFLTLKISNNGIRLSDTNSYFNMAYQVSQGKILYKDLFFSNLPFFSYIASFYYFLTGANIQIFYFTSAIEITIITSLIYLITYQKNKSYLTSTISSALYALSFIVLSTSDHQTGVFTASLFAVLSYFFLQKQKIIASGILIAFAIFTKAYFLPIFIAFIVFLALNRNWKNVFKFGAAFAITGLLALLPFLIQAPNQLISDVFGFSLTRPAGLLKTDLIWFYLNKDFPLFIVLIFNLLNIRKNIFFGLISIFSIIFFLGYQDVYYLYLNFLTPFLCLSFYEIYYFLINKLNLQRLIIPTVIFFFILLNISTYISNYKNLGKLENIDEIIRTIKVQNPKFLYGVNDITPALIALTHIPALNNVNDAHEYFFTRGIYNKELLTTAAIKSKTIIVTHGADYPQYNIEQDILDNIFVKNIVYTNCTKILSAPVQSEGDANRINLFKCY